MRANLFLLGLLDLDGLLAVLGVLGLLGALGFLGVLGFPAPAFVLMRFLLPATFARARPLAELICPLTELIFARASPIAAEPLPEVCLLIDPVAEACDIRRSANLLRF